MVTAKLQHPRCRHRRLPHEGEVILVLTEPDAATTAGAAAPAAPAASRARPAVGFCFAEHFVAADDVRDLPISVWTQGGREQGVYRAALRRREVPHAKALALKHRAR
jgi:hypothetical protein